MYQTYELFDLRIFRGHEGIYPIEVLRSPAGEAAGEFTLPFSESELNNILGRLESGETDREFLKAIGRQLYEMLFVPPIQRRYSESLAGLGVEQGLRLRLRVDPPELTPLPWEFLFDPQANEFLSLSLRAPLVRYVAAGAVEPLQVEAPVRLLLVVSNPSDAPPLDTGKEIALVQEALAPQIESGHYVVDLLEQVTLHRLADRLREGYHILHYVGHAYLDPDDGQGYLILEDEDGASLPVEADALSPMLKDTSLRVMVLNACESGRSPAGDLQAGGRDAQLGLAPSLVTGGLSAVVAMQFPVPDQTSILLAREFYSALADNAPVDAAISQARNVIRAELGADNVDWGIPVLFMRAPDGHILEVKPPPKPKGEALFSMRGWVAVGTVVTIVLALLGILAYPNLQSALQSVGVLPTPAPTLTPTPTLVATPAVENEFLVLVADFYSDDPQLEVPARLQPQIEAALEANMVPNARVVGVPDRPSNAEQAVALAARYNASIIVWGWYDALGFNARVEVIDSPWLEAIGRDVEKGEALVPQKSQALSEVDSYAIAPETLRAYIRNELAETVTYLVLYTIGRIHYWQAINLRDTGQDFGAEFEAAIRILEQAIADVEAKVENNPDANLSELGAEVLFFSRGTIYLNRSIYLNLDEWEKAIKDFERAIEIKPDYPQAHINLGWAYETYEEDFDMAREHYLLAAEADTTPNRWMYIHAYWNLGWLDYRLGNYEEALAVTQRAIDANPDDQAPDVELALSCNIGLYYMASSNLTGATAAYDSALSFAAAHPTAETASELAYCKGDLNDLVENREDLATAADPILDKISAAEDSLSAQESTP